MKILTVPERHQLRIAKQTLRMHDAAAAIMGGMTKEEAREFLRSIGWTLEQITTAESEVA